MIKKISKFIKMHKFIAGIIVIVLVVVGYLIIKPLFTKPTQITYVLGTVSKGTIISSISGSGQVSALSQVDVKSKASGDVMYVNVKLGQEVKSGAILAQLDSRDAQKAVRDAEINLENTQISLSKLEISQKSNIPDIEDSITNAQNNLEQTYQNGFNEVANTFLDLPSIIDGTRSVLYDYAVSTPNRVNCSAYQDFVVNSANNDLVASMISQAQSNYTISYNKYTDSLNNYRVATRYSSSDVIIDLIKQTLDTVKTIAQSAKDEQNLLDTVSSTLKQASRSVPSAMSQYQTNVSSYIGKLNSHLTSLNNTRNNIDSNQQSLENYQRQLSNAKDNNPLDLISQRNSLKQKQVALQDAKDNLANYYVRAPFDGVIAKLNISKGDSISSGTAIATFITNKKIATISLNEVDVAKVKVGQKATLTFDAIDGLNISGEVLEVDIIGTVSQGVVTYNVKIGFDTQDERIKSGMSASASVITDMKQDVLMVQSSAIKSSGNISYVEVPVGQTVSASANVNSGIILQNIPSQQEIQTGLTNDTYTEITSGLKEGDTIIIRTITASSATTTTSGTQNSIRIPGAGGFGR
ncbi:MAG: HlyD family efflux transporter periplasmic adaptor subunit [Candidatus Portnoybacteria bacterium]|nr:HlyD family efflux transporter periplasmic adaptor subunit [Candidatus Portnoybacteria bacterium]